VVIEAGLADGRGRVRGQIGQLHRGGRQVGRHLDQTHAAISERQHITTIAEAGGTQQGFEMKPVGDGHQGLDRCRQRIGDEVSGVAETTRERAWKRQTSSSSTRSANASARVSMAERSVPAASSWLIASSPRARKRSRSTSLSGVIGVVGSTIETLGA
jgi:hypothetical protein